MDGFAIPWDTYGRFQPSGEVLTPEEISVRLRGSTEQLRGKEQ
jgi:hypothetical protein